MTAAGLVRRAPRHRLSPRTRRAAAAEADAVGVRRTPRHELSPRARRQAAEADARAGQAPMPSAEKAHEPMEVVAFAAGELDVDVTGVDGSVLPYVARAAAEAMPSRTVHIAIGPGGPVISDAGDLNMAGLTRRLSELDAATETPAPKEVEVTLTILASELAAETVPPEPGQLGTLVVGQSVERPAVVRLTGGGSGIAVRSFARLTFSYDHRALGRDDAARFLTAVKHRLEAPWTSAG